jgi:carboxypeptidase PM20D1
MSALNVSGSWGGAFPAAVSRPYGTMAATDSRHFAAISPRVHRRTPVEMAMHRRDAIHGVDEHLGVEGFPSAIAWYRTPFPL